MKSKLMISYGVILLMASFPIKAFSEAGLTAAPILSRAIGARAGGMGQAFTSISGGSESIIYNPAGAVFISNPMISMTYLKGFIGDNNQFVSASAKTGPLVISIASLFYDAGTMNLNLSDGTKKKVTAAKDTVNIVGIAFSLFDGFGLGTSIKLSKLRLAETASASGRHYDFGVLYSGGNGISLGASYQNIGDDIKFEEVGDPPPRTFRAGASMRKEFDPPNRLDSSADIDYCALIMAVDYVKPQKDAQYYQTGLEMDIGFPYLSSKFRFTVRTGYLFGRSDENFTFGLGAKQGIWGVDYSFGNADNLYSKHQITANFYF